MIIKDVKESLEEKAAWIIADAIQELLDEQHRVVLAVPGGKSVSGIFEQLKEESVDWEKVHIFMVDERIVPLDDPESNFLLVKEHLLRHGIPEEHVHPFRHDQGAKAYAEELEKVGGKFDIVLVSSGEDGHIAGLFPKHHSLTSTGAFITMDDSPKPPAKRMSASRALVERSDTGVVVFFGEAKQEALRRFLDEGPVDECPARLIKTLPRWYALTDQEAL